MGFLLFLFFGIFPMYAQLTSLPATRRHCVLHNLMASVNILPIFSCFKSFLQAPCGNNWKGISGVTAAISILLVWALLYILFHQQVEPGGQLFALILLAVFSYFCGWLVSLVNLPPLLGMLLSGIVLQNLGMFNVAGVYTEIIAVIRQVALTVMLLEAGLRLDASALKKFSFVVLRLTLLPCISEALAIAVAANVLMNMPWLWALLLGLVLCSVSPAVLVPSLTNIKQKGYGETNGIRTLLTAASSFDDVVSTSGFSVVLGVVFSQGNLVSNILQGPVNVVIGLLLGFGWGFVAACIPHRNENHVILKRTFMVGVGGIVAVFGTEMFHYSGSGPLAVIILAFLASLCWKWQGWSNTHNPVADNFGNIWTMIEPLLFGLIGTEIIFSNIRPQIIGESMGVLFFGLVIRVIACRVALTGDNLSTKEILFVCISWLPKATVQAALGPVALDFAQKEHREDAIPWATTVLSVAVLSILITAPLGAIGISFSGPRLLSKDEPVNKNERNQQIRMVAVINSQAV